MLVHRREGKLFAITGASRSGKSLWTAQQVARARRLLVWDYPKGEWARLYRCRRISTPAELREVVVPGAPAERVAFMRISEKPDQDFEMFCRLAWIYVQAHGAPLVVEETATVTSSSKAPPAWGNICRMGLGYGSDIYALTQRPAESDKTAFGNASVIHCGRAVTPRDRQTIAEYLDVSLDEVRSLQPLQFIERHASGAKKIGYVNTKLRT